MTAEHAKHTPGPWRVAQPCLGFSEIRGGNGELIFGIAAGSGEERQPDAVCEANGRLIAAAPDLLAALEEWLQPYDCPPDELIARAIEGGSAGVLCECIARSRAIIRQAKGG